MCRPIVRHLSAERAEIRYRAREHPIEKLRWHAVWLLLRADPVRTPAQVADLMGLFAAGLVNKKGDLRTVPNSAHGTENFNGDRFSFCFMNGDVLMMPRSKARSPSRSSP